MKKVISYSLFQMPNIERWLFYVYLRGLVWNVKMCRAVYPDYEVHIQVDAKTFSEFNNIFFGLCDIYGCKYSVNPPMDLCRAMITRMRPIFEPDVEICLTRDADSIVTYREAVAVEQWIKSKDTTVAMTLKDNAGHSLELMGGMSNYKCDLIRLQYATWDNFMKQIEIPLQVHGSDQRYLMETIYTRFKDFIRVVDMQGISKYEHPKLEGVKEELYLSNLIPAFIGTAGINEMEYNRFQEQFLKNDAMEQIEKSYPNVFYKYQL